MKTESNICPQAVTITNLPDDVAEIVLCDNIKLIDNTYVYDMYCINTPMRQNLGENIKNNFNLWLSLAKSKENS